MDWDFCSRERCFGLEIVAGGAGRGCGFQAWTVEVLPELFISALRTEAMFGDQECCLPLSGHWLNCKEHKSFPSLFSGAAAVAGGRVNV